MKLKKLFSLLALLFMGLTLSCALTACGDDKDDDEPNGTESELIGYWYWEEDGDFEAMSLNEGGYGEYLYGSLGNPESVYSDYISWNENQVQGVKVISVDSKELVQKEDDEIIVYKRISAKEWSNLKRTATLDGSDSGNTDKPGTPDTPDTPDSPDQTSSLLAGTNWSGTIDGDYVELSFKSNGTFVEIYDGDRSTSTYTELDSNTIIIGDGTVMSNTFGENPFHFELSSNKSTLTFSNNYDTWKLKRKA